MKKHSFIFLIIVLVGVSKNCFAQKVRPAWSNEQANAWYANYSWMSGSDFIPSTAINQLEMWQAETFDSATIDHELGYAQSIGMSVMRVFLHHLAWQIDSAGFKNRVNTYLSIADKHGIKTIFVFFDDCWNATYHAGTQPAPKVGIHNSGWVRDPGQLLYDSPTVMNVLQSYVKDILSTFAHDKRIFVWDLYNEPGNSDYGNKSMRLLQQVFFWGREINPDQPLTAGIWSSSLNDLNTCQLANSDVISYHDYNPLPVHQKTIDTLKKYDKPLICTEYMARPRNSTFFTIMPLLKQNKVVAINWGLVTGKTNTMYAWDTPMPGGEEPKIWFHDIFRKDGTPYNKDETKFITSLNEKK